MAVMDGKHLEHKRHRHILYTLVVILALIQITTFIIFTIQISRLSIMLNKGIENTNIELKEYSKNLVESYDSVYQENFKEISDIVRDQQESVEKEISLLKSSTQDDFSGIIKQAVKSVVTVSTENSIGSGFIVSEDGYIVTNYHVVKDKTDSISVLTYQKNIEPAILVGKDEVRDLALLKIPEKKYTYLELADSDDLDVGNKVIAIGNPLGLTFTVTEGIVSGLDRVGPNGIAEYVQTDVSLNPGNSGGPLIDMQGKVVGINNFKIGGAESLGFSLKSNAIKKSINRIINETIIA